MPGLEALMDHGLAMNRKERFFTGTVFPMLVCADGFAHFGRLTTLAGLGQIHVDASPGGANVQFFTEYGFRESVVGSATARFPNVPQGKDTPDVLIYVDGHDRCLIGIEAKMYDRPSTATLRHQLSRQETLLAYLADRLGVPAERVAHLALLPEGLAREVSTAPTKLLTWEELLDTFADVGEPYFVEMLRIALDRHHELASQKTATFGANADAKLTGEEIAARFREGSLDYAWMGRQQGLYGPKVADDLATGRWRAQPYECRTDALPHNKNWFAVAEFVARLDHEADSPAEPHRPARSATPNELGFRANAEAVLTGQEIVDAFERGALEYPWMGRGQGIDGTRLAQDIETGRWRTQRYECRTTPLPGNPNWFAVKHFVRRLGSKK